MDLHDATSLDEKLADRKLCGCFRVKQVSSCWFLKLCTAGCCLVGTSGSDSMRPTACQDKEGRQGWIWLLARKRIASAVSRQASADLQPCLTRQSVVWAGDTLQ